MMSDAELAELGQDIKKNGQQIPILFWTGDQYKTSVLIDGRNRLEAMERLGILDDVLVETFHCGDPVSHIISRNLRRRHLSQQERADLIVAAIKAGQKPPQHEAVSKGGRGKKNPVKEKAVAAGKAHGISKATVERSLAKAEGKTPKPRTRTIDASRRAYFRDCEELEDLDAERAIAFEAFKEIAGRRAGAR
jgi:hypothetical protein